MGSKLEPAIWSLDTGQQIPCFDRRQLIITWNSNIKMYAVNYSDTGHIGIHGFVDVRICFSAYSVNRAKIPLN